MIRFLFTKRDELLLRYASLLVFVVSVVVSLRCTAKYEKAHELLKIEMQCKKGDQESRLA